MITLFPKCKFRICFKNITYRLTKRMIVHLRHNHSFYLSNQLFFQLNYQRIFQYRHHNSIHAKKQTADITSVGNTPTPSNFTQKDAALPSPTATRIFHMEASEISPFSDLESLHIASLTQQLPQPVYQALHLLRHRLE